MEFIDILGLVAGAFTSAASIPQIITAVKTKKTEHVSILMFIVLLTGNALWTYYGFLKKDFPIIATNLLAVVLDIVMLILKRRYDKNRKTLN